MKLVLQSIGFSNVREIDELEVLEISAGAITALPFFGEQRAAQLALRPAADEANQPENGSVAAFEWL